jgi:drug/metabolite transporter (DMT)-like permease
MAVDAAPASVLPSDNRAAAGFFLLGVLISTGMVYLVKTLGQEFSPFQIMLARGVVMAALLAPFALRRRVAPPALGGAPMMMAVRALTTFGGQAFGIAAIAALPLAQAQSIGFAKGFLVAGLAVAFLGERVDARRWAAIAIGFAGVLSALEPAGALTPGALFALASAVCFAVSTILIKQLTRDTDSLTLVVWGAIGQALLSAPFAAFMWRPPAGQDWLFLGLLGVCAIALQFAMLAAYRRGDVSALAPLDYTRLITGAAVGFLAFGETPSLAVAAGAVLIVAGNLLLVTRPRTNR